MTCTLIKELFDLYIENRLVSFQARWLEHHTASCPECAAELAAWRMRSNELKTLPAAAIPADFKTGLKAALTNIKNFQTITPEDNDPAILSDNLPALAFAFSFLSLLIAVSGSFLGPGAPSQACTGSPSSICAVNAPNYTITGD